MRQPGWDEPAEPSGQAPAQGPGHTGVVESGEYEQGLLPPTRWRPATAPPRWYPDRPDIVAGLVAIAALAALGLPVAVLWWAVAPRLGVRVVSPGTVAAVAPEAEQYFATDGWYLLLTLVVGVLAAVVMWRLRSTRGPAALVALTLAGLAGAVVTWKFGTVLAPAPTESALRDVGRVVYPALRLRATAALVVEPVAAVVTYLLCAGFAAQNDLGRQDTPAGRDPDLN